MALHHALRGLRLSLRNTRRGFSAAATPSSTCPPELQPLESRLLLAGDSPCGNYGQPTLPQFCPT